MKDESLDVIVRKRKTATRVLESDSESSEEVVRRGKKRPFKKDKADEEPSKEKTRRQFEPKLSSVTPAMENLTLKQRGNPVSQKDIKELSKISTAQQDDEVAEDLLQGLTIVLTGIFEMIGREKLENFINNHGGRCTGSISGKTTHLIIGVKLEDGREVT